MMLTRRRSRADDQGETLIELLMAVAIMGIAVVAIVGGIATTILISDIHRKEATAGASVRNYAEAVFAYAANGGFDATSSPDYSPSTVGFPTPAGGYVPSASVRCWDNNALQFGACGSACTVQQVTVTVASSDLRASETLVVTVRKQ